MLGGPSADGNDGTPAALGVASTGAPTEEGIVAEAGAPTRLGSAFVKGTTIDPKVKFIMASCMLGWTGGKFAALKSGPAATKNLLKISAFTFAPVVYGLFGDDLQFDFFLQAALWAGYLYFGLAE